MAVVTGVDGPHYRNPGAFMAFAADGRAAGQLTSGCIERDLALHAIDVAATGRPKTLRYGAGSPYVDLQLPCGGALEVSLLRADIPTISKAVARRHARRPSRLGLDLVGGGMALDGPGFVLDMMPPTAFSVWGAGIEAVTFAALAHAAGFPARLHSHDETTLASARAHGVATAGPVWEDADRWTAVVMFYHDHDKEPALLREALRSDAFYIGAQGSLRTHDARKASLTGLGLSVDEIARLRGPIGLIRSARDPRVLAVSVLAEILAEAL
ncbi:XdhC family protein [Paracoccus aminovorans]|uniref:XdhC family protein n=1 Tax=Paracoccus aminovorans TaxID=34004 RepID=UPI002B258B52|nr:XdhC family protein [Paracoccus aminovorans]